MRVSEIMKTNLVTILPDEPIGKAIKIMEQYRFRRLPVVWDGHLIGIITDRDIRKAQNSSSVFNEASYDKYLHNE
jgi:CBS domain-containing protein